MAKLTGEEARSILAGLALSDQPDFHALRSSTVGALLVHADRHRYRTHRHANGSRGRCWYNHLCRTARRHWR